MLNLLYAEPGAWALCRAASAPGPLLWVSGNCQSGVEGARGRGEARRGVAGVQLQDGGPTQLCQWQKTVLGPGGQQCVYVTKASDHLRSQRMECGCRQSKLQPSPPLGKLYVVPLSLGAFFPRGGSRPASLHLGGVSPGWWLSVHHRLAEPPSRRCQS